MYKTFFIVRCLLFSALLSACAFSQDASIAAPKAALEHVIGTITTVDKSAQTITVQEDKTNVSHVIQLANTKTLLKVEPTAKDLKSAVRITADDLDTGDRVDVRGSKMDDPSSNLTAKSVILMSGRDLATAHQQQAAAWSKATSARVTAVDPASGKITADVRASGASQSVTIQSSPTTEFTRYSPDTAKAVPSQISQIQVGDQMKVLGDKNDDGSLITAQKIYSGAFRTIAITVSSVSADGKSITGKDLSSKKEVVIALTEDASIHKLTPMMAGFLARRLNPNAAPTTGAPGAGGPPGGAPNAGMPGGAPPAGGNGTSNWNPNGAGGPAGAAGPTGPSSMGPGSMGPGGPGAGRGDVSQMIQRTPTIAASDLKPGDALVISGVATGADSSRLLANTVIAGVEPILQAAPSQRSGGRSVGGDWGLGEMAAPAQ